MPRRGLLDVLVLDEARRYVLDEDALLPSPTDSSRARLSAAVFRLLRARRFLVRVLSVPAAALPQFDIAPQRDGRSLRQRAFSRRVQPLLACTMQGRQAK